MTIRHIDDGERRARLRQRHLTEPAGAGSIEELVDDLVVLHATDPATIYLSVGARLDRVTVADVDVALFQRRTLYRALAMRRTLFVATDAIGPAVEGSSSPRIASQERKRLSKFLVDTGVTDPDRWLASLFEEVLAVLAREDEGSEGRSARELVAEVPRLATRVVTGLGTRQQMEMTATSRVLSLMAVEGLLVRGRPAGGWTTRQYRWHRRDRWCSADTQPHPTADAEAAAAELLGHYVARFGPVTLTDLAWWTGWTKTSTRAALARLAVAEVTLDGDGDAIGHVLADDVEPVGEGPGDATAQAALWPSLDPTPMGWKQRSWYLGPHQEALFDRNGNIGPTVWVGGRIVGGWGQRPDGEVVVEYLEDVGADGQALVDVEIERVQRFVGDVVVKPSFPTPLQKRLAS